MAEISPYLQGALAPVDEEVTALDLPVTGRIPTELSGRYLRNGPNPLGLEDPNYHWFLGAGMVHGVRLREGRAEWYRNRWVRSQAVAEALGEPRRGDPVAPDFAANTHIIRHGGRLLATVEAGPLPYELTDELGTIGQCDFGGTLGGGFAAHTKLDPRTGELHVISYSPLNAQVRHLVVAAAGNVSRSVDIDVPGQPMMHDFALTESYVVLLDLPVTLSMAAAQSGAALPYTWNPEHPARIGLLPRAADEFAAVRWYPVEPCWVFHTLNAYEDEAGRVVLDVCRYPRGYDVSTLSGHGSVTLDRWTIDPAAGKLVEERLDDRPQEFPRVDERVISRPHRYGYSAVASDVIEATFPRNGDFSDDAFGNALLKHDLHRRTVDAHTFGIGEAVGEAVFAPAHPDGAEDDGYVMSFVHNPDRGAADLVILSAQDFTAAPVARIHLPVRIPLGFHGSWLPDA